MSVQSGEKLVVTSRVGHVFKIGINRPHKRNCVSIATGEQLVKAFKEFEEDDDLWVAVFYGEGGVFCGGFDLENLSKVDVDAMVYGPYSKDPMFRPLGCSKMTFSKPVIAAVQGYAVAGGLEMAILADMRVVEKSAIMGVFCRRFGVPLTDGGTVRLPKLIGLSRAMDMILTGRGVGADEALQFGLANRVVPDGTAVDEAVKLAQQLCEFPQLCVRQDKRSAHYSAYDAPSFTNAFDYEFLTSIPVLKAESVPGAKTFVAGVGRHGSFAPFDPNRKSKL